MPLQNLAYTALLLGVLVTVHELGHFLVAKACRVKVLRFSIGFGPALLRFTRGETEYRLAALPLGGYVKMAGDMPDEELPPEEASRGFLAQPPWKRALIVAAGPAFSLLFPVLVYFAVFFGAHEAISNRIGGVEPGMPAAAAGLKAGDRILAVDGEKTETFEQYKDALQSRYGQSTTLTIEREGKTFTVQLNPATTVESNAIESLTRGTIGVSPVARPPVVGVPLDSPAHAAGLRTFDRILSINDQPVKDEGALNAIVHPLEGALTVEVMRADPVELPGTMAALPRLERLTLPRQAGEGYAALGAERNDLYVYYVLPGSSAEKAGLRHGDRLLETDGKPIPSMLALGYTLKALEQRPFQLTWRSGLERRTAEVAQLPIEDKDELGQVTRTPALGVAGRPLGTEEDFSAERVTLHMGAMDALVESVRIVPDIIRKTVLVLGRLITGHIPFENVGGPIMLYEIASKSAEQGFDMFLQSMAIISINLGVMNLLPIPMLDGFHLVAAIWEGIRRRPIPVKAREIANWVGLCMLILLMVLVFKNDLTR
ncbi:MAG: RIP metalloprotease RseP [Myxococcota bacterium]|nr:RIP metalloprotease RseP [Myxococcota bacterium]